MAKRTVIDPRKAVVRQLAARFDHFAEEDATLIASGRYSDALDAHEFAFQLIRAYRAELDDPEPEAVPCSLCGGVEMCDLVDHLMVDR